jgi:hypothetical protein
MAIENLKFRLNGVTPILMHCGQTSDPLNDFSKALKRISGKRSKTDDDHAEMSIIEWWAGLYLSKPCEIDGATVTPDKDAKIIIPAHVLDSALRAGARITKNGKVASAGCMVDGNGAFAHDGPTDLVKLSTTPRFVHRASVKVGQSRVIRTRPVFESWSVTFGVDIDPSVIEPQMVLDALSDAGRLVGIGDWRPGAPRGGSYGRFGVEVL